MSGFWNWALAAYRAPGVSDACLTLQDTHGHNVPLLLWAGWTAATGRALDEETIEAACDAARAWDGAAVGPLRDRSRATAAAQARKAEAALKAPITGDDACGTTGMQRARDTELPLDTEEWELSEGGLPEGSTLSGSKALMEEYPDDEANPKKAKKTNTGKGKKSKAKA